MARSARLFVMSSLAVCLGGSVVAQQETVAPAQRAQSARRPPSGDAGRAQYPAFLANSFINLNLGYIGYPFSQLQLEPTHTVDTVAVPHVAAQAVLFGHHFGKYVSAQASYMRPIEYVKYRNVDGRGTRSVWLHFGTLTVRGRVPINERLSVYGESGLAITNRSGFEIDDVPVVKDLHYSSFLLGTGLEYRVNPAWDLVAGAIYIPSRSNQPRTIFSSLGVRYNMRPLPPERVEETLAAGFLFPKQLIQLGYATNAFGYGVNNVLSKRIPVFWGGGVEVKRSVIAIQYGRNMFHTKKVVAFDLGASFSQWRSRDNGERFWTLSVYPLVRFTLLRRPIADFYLSYSVAGPSYISRKVIDGREVGSHFTFQDRMGVGLFMGEQRRLNAEIELNHYSNGNLFFENAGVKIPLTFKVGYAF